VLDVATLVDSLDQIVRGGTVLDPEVVRYLLSRAGTRDRVAGLTERERDVLSLMAQGRSNRAIARDLFMNLKTVESHTASMFGKLDLLVQPDDHRRVLAVLAWLRV
jgi:DNA-binding NarL/FixJ family response regulator